MTTITIHRPNRALRPTEVVESLRRRLHAPVRLTRAGLRWFEIDATAPRAAVEQACAAADELQGVRWEVAP